MFDRKQFLPVWYSHAPVIFNEDYSPWNRVLTVDFNNNNHNALFEIKELFTIQIQADDTFLLSQICKVNYLSWFKHLCK